MRQRHLWALIPAALAIFNMGVQLTITFFDDRGGGQYGTSYEVRWLFDLGIYLAYLAGLTLVDLWRKRRVLMGLGATIAFGFTSAGWFAGDSIGGGFLLLVGSFATTVLGILLVVLVVKRHGHNAAIRD